MLRLRCLVLVVICLAAWMISGCGGMASNPLPTQLPTGYIPTAVALTIEASELQHTLAVTKQPTPEPTYTPAPSPIPDASPTPTAEFVDRATASPSPTVRSEDQPGPGDRKPPEGLPNKPIQILSPGPSSRVISPFLLRSTILIGPTGVVRLELLGEDGRLLMREVQHYPAAAGKQMGLGVEINYEIAAAAETGRLQIGVEDEHGRLMAQSSVDLILLSMGEADVSLPADQLEDLYIESPRPNALIQGGQARVSGWARTRSEKPLMIEFQAGDGRIVGTRQVAVEPVPGSTHGTFMVDVPYLVESPTRVRLVLWESGDRIPGIVHLSSEEVVLSP